MITKEQAKTLSRLVIDLRNADDLIIRYSYSTTNLSIDTCLDRYSEAIAAYTKFVEEITE